jgi:hypothetical protein
MTQIECGRLPYRSPGTAGSPVDTLAPVGIIEYLSTFGKIDAMFGEVARGFRRVPFEVHIYAYR